MLVCQQCGFLVRSEITNCSGCAAFVSPKSSTELPNINQAASTVPHGLRPDPLVLERIITNKPFADALVKPENGGNAASGKNGDPPLGNGSANSELLRNFLQSAQQATEPAELDFGPGSARTQSAQSTITEAETPVQEIVPPIQVKAADAPPPPPLQSAAAPTVPQKAEDPSAKPEPDPKPGRKSDDANEDANRRTSSTDFFDKGKTTPEPPPIHAKHSDDFFDSPPADFFTATHFNPASADSDDESAKERVDKNDAPPTTASGSAVPPSDAVAKTAAADVDEEAATDSKSESSANKVEPPSDGASSSAQPVSPPLDGSEHLAPQAPSSASAASLAEAFASARKRKHITEDGSDDDDAPPKVARPKGFKPASARVKPTDDDDDADDDHDAAPSKNEPPKRRSFSDKSSIHTDNPEEAHPLAGKFGFLGETVNVFGMSMKRINQLFLIALAGLIIFVGISSVFAIVGPGESETAGGGNSKPNAHAPIAGRWQINTTFNGVVRNGYIEITQHGSDITGSGIDEMGPGRSQDFAFEGKVTDNGEIQFTKYYNIRDRRGKAAQDKPINFGGRITGQQGRMLNAAGKWVTHRAVGRFMHAQIREFSGDWYARQVAYSSESTNSNKLWDDTQKFRWFYEDWPQSTKLMAIAGIFLAIIIGCVGVSFSLFGPAGLLNILEKQKYIPSQYKSQHMKMVKQMSKRLEPGGLPLGQRLEWRIWKIGEWGHKELNVPAAMRKADPHILVVGAGDKGKSRLIAGMIANDILANDRAVVVIDSDGGLIDLIANWIASRPNAKELTKRVILLDPTYKDGSLGYNPLEFPDDGDMQSAASSIVYGFKAIYTEPPGAQSQWNQQTANILRNCAILLMANGKTLTDVPTLLNDNDFRDVMLEAVERRKNERAEFITLLETWGQYKRLARTDQWITWCEPILNRVSPMLGDARIRNILTKPQSDVRLTEVITEKKILLVKVAKGQLDQNAKLLGSLVVTGIKQAALLLSTKTNMGQPPVSLFLDEFDDFIDKDTIQTITTETEKFKLGFVGVAKTLQHLPEDYRNTLIISVGMLCSFALAKKDGDMLAPQMFRVDGRKIKHRTIQMFFNRVNTQPTFELIMDEEKLNIDRIVGQDPQTFFCYQVGTVAGVFHLKSYPFPDIPKKDINRKLIDKMHGIYNKTPKSKEPADEATS